MNVHVIRTSGREEDLDITRFDEVRRLIGAHTLDMVDLRDGRTMVVDDLGYEVEEIDHGIEATPFGLAHRFERRPVRALRPVNEKATKLYWAVCAPGTSHRIVGDVAVISNAELE